MSSNKCARCEQTVYPVEGLRCLDKIWHKGCFKCQECSMTLNLKNYKGFEKKPYCNAHCPQAKATTVADTPEIRRLAENTRIQSQAKYHEDFEKSKGKGFTAIADDPETLRIKETSKIISNVAYHGELERKKQMEEKRIIGGPEEVHNNININNNNNNNNSNNNGNNNIRQHQQIKFQRGNAPQNQDASNFSPLHLQQQQQQQQIHHQQIQQQQQHQIHQQQQLQQKHHLQKQQKQHRSLQGQQQQQQQVLYAQDHNGQSVESHQLHHFSGQMQQQQQPPSSAKHNQQYNPSSHTNQQEQQILMRQQQQMLQQQQHQMMQQQQRQSIDLNMASSRQVPKQSINNNNNHIKYQQMIPSHQLPQQMRYVPMNDAASSQQAQIMSGLRMINPNQMGEMASNSQRIVSNAALIGAQPQAQHNMIYNYTQMNHLNGAMQPKQHHYVPRQTIYPNQMQPINHQMLPHIQQQHNQQMQPVQSIQQMQSQVPKRVYRAIYDYVANDIDEVSFFENDILIDCVNVDGNWLIGKVARSGQTGMLPANYVVEFSK